MTCDILCLYKQNSCLMMKPFHHIPVRRWCSSPCFLLSKMVCSTSSIQYTCKTLPHLHTWGWSNFQVQSLPDCLHSHNQYMHIHQAFPHSFWAHDLFFLAFQTMLNSPSRWWKAEPPDATGFALRPLWKSSIWSSGCFSCRLIDGVNEVLWVRLCRFGLCFGDVGKFAMEINFQKCIGFRKVGMNPAESRNDGLI